MAKCGYCQGSLKMIYYLNTDDGKLYCSATCFAKAKPKVTTLPPLTSDECNCKQCQEDNND